MRESILANIVIVVLLITLIGIAIAYIWNQKKQGVKCIGCPSAKQCHSKSHSCSSCEKK